VLRCQEGEGVKDLTVLQRYARHRHDMPTRV
jgi:hypothetical protein